MTRDAQIEGWRGEKASRIRIYCTLMSKFVLSKVSLYLDYFVMTAPKKIIFQSLYQWNLGLQSMF